MSASRTQFTYCVIRAVCNTYNARCGLRPGRNTPFNRNTDLHDPRRGGTRDRDVFVDSAVRSVRRRGIIHDPRRPIRERRQNVSVHQAGDRAAGEGRRQRQFES